MIRTQAGTSTTRFCALIDMPERTWRRWQARARAERRPRGPWPAPAAQAVEPAVVRHAEAHLAWGHRKIWAMTRYDGHTASPATVLRVMRSRGLLLEAAYQRERRQLAAAGKAAFCQAPNGPNQVWQLDFPPRAGGAPTEFETTTGGVWRLGACRDYWSKYEFGWHLSPTANQHDALAAIDLAMLEAARVAGATSLLEQVTDPVTGLVQPVTIVTDNGGPFRSFWFEAYIATAPELHHVRTRVRTPGQNGTRERGFGTLKYEWLYREQVDTATDLAAHAEAYRVEYNTVRPHEAIAWNRPHDVHIGTADPAVPTFDQQDFLPTT